MSTRVALGHQPVVELHLLLGGGMEFVPHVGAATGRTQPGDPQCGTVTCCQSGEFVELVDVVPRHHDRDLGVLEARVGQVLQRSDRHRERAGAAHGVVDLSRRAVEGDLHVDVIACGQPRRHARG